MIAIDTNVLVRLLVNDPKELSQIKAAKSMLQSSGQVYLPQIVQVETVWVLESAYRLEKESIIKALEHIKMHEAFVLQYPDSFNKALTYYRNNNVDFSDCLILWESQIKRCNLATFDKKLGKLPGAQQII